MANLFPALVLDAKDYWKVLNVNKFKQLLEETGHTFEQYLLLDYPINTTQHDTKRHNTTRHKTTQHNTTQKDTKIEYIFFK